MSVIKVLRGIQGIGKSTYAQSVIENDSSYVRVNKDAIRMMESPTYNRSNGELVDSVMHSFIETALKLGKNVVIDNTNCFLKHIDDIIYRYHLLADIEIVAFPNDTMLAITQNDKRSGWGWIEPKIISEFSAGFRKAEAALDRRGYQTRITEENRKIYHIPKKKIIPNVSVRSDMFKSDKQTVVVWDLDNTLALKGDRGIYDFHLCNLDTPIHSSMAVFGAMSEIYKPIFVTGRGEECRRETLEWINTYLGSDIESDQLYMRPWKDFRRDSMVKEEIYNTQIKDRYYISCWFDDSPKVIKEFLIPYNIPVFDSTHSHYDNIL